MNNTPKNYTVSELSQILGVSVNTTWKKIKKRGLTTLKDTINNRVITLVSLTPNELESLIQEKKQFNPVNKGINNKNYEDLETINEVNEPQMNNSAPPDLYTLMEKVMDYSKDMNSQLKGYVDRIVEAEKQVKLLEDSESRKDSEFHRIQAENKELKEKILIMENELKQLKNRWWNKKVF